jgi:hemerythrin-like domain-containing protein
MPPTANKQIVMKMGYRYLPTAFDVLLQTSRPAPRKKATRAQPAESLLLAHGLAERVMLVYDRVVKGWKLERDADVDLVRNTAQIARDSIAGCHERDEERWLFPLFREEGYVESLVDALEEQHAAGRQVTDKILELASPGRIRNETQMNMLMTLCRSYVFMYRPHLSRENSELFPKLSHIAPPETVADIARRMEESTQDALGGDGFAGPLRELAEIEQSLDINDLRGYTVGNDIG